jgi:hypothetical protein
MVCNSAKSPAAFWIIAREFVNTAVLPSKIRNPVCIAAELPDNCELVKMSIFDEVADGVIVPANVVVAYVALVVDVSVVVLA